MMVTQLFWHNELSKKLQSLYEKYIQYLQPCIPSSRSQPLLYTCMLPWVKALPNAAAHFLFFLIDIFNMEISAAIDLVLLQEE